MFFRTSDPNSAAGILWKTVIEGTPNQIQGGAKEGIEYINSVRKPAFFDGLTINHLNGVYSCRKTWPYISAPWCTCEQL